MKFKYFFVLIFGFFILAVKANDTTMADENGTITFTQSPDIKMDQEDLFISEDLIQVRYVFINESDKDLEREIAFPMPPIYYGDSDHSEMCCFKLSGDVSETAKSRFQIKLNDGSDITETVEALGWTAKDLISRMEITNSSASPWEKLPEGAQALPKVWIGENGNGFWPNFTIQEIYTWKQTFPAKKPITITHSYRPSVASSVPIQLSSLPENACLNETFSNQKLDNKNNKLYSWGGIDYILKTGANWKNSRIGKFNLTLRKKHANQSISLCFKGDFIKKDPLTLVFSAQNYLPEDDLHIVFFKFDSEIH